MSSVTEHGTAATRGTAVRVLVPSLLWSYTEGLKTIDLSIPHGEPSASLGDVLAELDRRYHGLRFRIIDEQGRIRAHIKIFVGGELARDLTAPVAPAVEVMIVGALSGG